MSASSPIPHRPTPDLELPPLAPSPLDQSQLEHPLARAFASFTEAASSGALSLD